MSNPEGDNIKWHNEDSIHFLERVESEYGLSWKNNVFGSLYAQNFERKSLANTDYDKFMSHEDENIFVAYDRNEDQLDIHMDGEKLSEHRQIELANALTEGHNGNADSLLTILEAEKNPTYSRLH